MKSRLPFYEYWETETLQVPYASLARAFENEIYFRKFTPTFVRNDLMQGHLSALLYWYHIYVDVLYEIAASGKDPMLFFKGLPTEIKDGFDYLFPQLKKTLEKVRNGSLQSNHLDELKFKPTRH
jgi:hypothetical protein